MAGRASVRTVAGWAGLTLFLVPLYWIVSSGLLAPLWAIVVLLVLWIAALGWAIRIRPRHPWRVLILPVALVAIWLLVISIGRTALGWTP